MRFSKDGTPYWYLEQWRGREGNQKCEITLKEARRIGIEFHRCMEEYFNTNAFETEDKNVERMMNNFIDKFVIPFNVKAKSTETTHENKKLKLQGTNDVVIECDGVDEKGVRHQGEYTLDGKTSSSLDTVGGPIQLAIYDHLRKGSNKGVLVRPDKKTDRVEIVWYEDLEPYKKLIKHINKVARYVRFGEV